LAQSKKEKKDVSEKGKELATVIPRHRATALAPRRSDIDNVFRRFQRDVEDLFWPSERSLAEVLSLPSIEVRIPSVDIEDRGKDFLLKAEMPGFKSKEIEVNVQNDAIEIQAETGWKYDDKKKRFIRKERGSESFYRMVQLPEEVNVDDVDAELKDGVLEVVLPKKTPKHKKRINVK
jgi:HSP20 family protein